MVDEIERGLEPYRQRLLIQRVQTGNSQAFVTTHSAPAIAAAAEARIWYIDGASRIGPLDGRKIAAHQRQEPETFLARLAIVGEGLTEVGFASALLEKALGSSLDQYGVRVSDGGGHEATLGLLEALADGGLIFGGFADEEGKHPERWKRLHEKLGTLLFRWKAGCVEENVINAVPLDNLFRLIEDPQDELTGMRLRTLALRLDIPEKNYGTITTQARENLKSLIIGAALGSVPTGREADQKELRAHARLWFKTQAGGRELAGKIIPLYAWKELRDQLLPFLNAVRKTVGLSELMDLS